MTLKMCAAVIAFALGSSVVFAQQASPSDVPQSTSPVGHGHRHNPHHEARMLSRQLNLTPDQTMKTEVVLADRDERLTALRADTTASPEGMKDRRASIRLDTMQKLSNIFTPEQMQQMRSMQKHGRGHGGALTVPTPA